MATGVALAGCGGESTDAGPDDPTDPPSASAPAPSPSSSPGPETPSPPASPSTDEGPGPGATPSVAGVVAENLDVPWGLAFLPDGSALVSQRDEGTIVSVTAGGEVTEVGQVPGVSSGGEGGLLGIAVSPDFGSDRMLYAYFTSDSDNRVARMRLEGGRLGEPEVVLNGIDKASVHNGGRIAFGPDGFLYVGTGDAGEEESSQSRESLNGKILRITPDGQPALGNPFDGSPIWSLGHRNVQGLGWDADGRMWASEFGQNEFDELNLIEPGNNYGWPVVEGQGGPAEYADPAVVWPTSEASPSGITVVGQAVYLAALRGSRLWQVPVPDGTAGEPRDFLSGKYGRLRTVAAAPDGSLWLMTNNTDGRGEPRPGDDQIVRVTLR